MGSERVEVGGGRARARLGGIVSEPTGARGGLAAVLPRAPMAGRRGRRPRWATALGLTPDGIDELLQEIEQLIAEGHAPSTRRAVATARRSWDAFVDAVAGERPDPIWEPGEYGMSLRSSLHNEITLMMYAAWLVRLGLQAGTASTYLSLTRVSMEAELGWKLTLRDQETRLPRMMRALRRMFSCIRRRRIGWRAHHQRTLRQRLGPAQGVVATTQDAVLCTAREGMARCCELGPARALDFDPAAHPTVGDVRIESTPETHMVLMLLPAKKPPGRRHKVPVPLSAAVDADVGAYAALQRMLAARRTAAGRELRSDEPLFAGPDGQALTSGQMVGLFKTAARCVGLPDGDVAGHSGRIGGATDHFAAETPPAVLQICGRWDSDLWQVYTRQCIEQTLRYAVAASACTDVSLEETYEDYVQPAAVARLR